MVSDHEFKEALKVIDRNQRIVVLYLMEQIDGTKQLRVLDENRIKEEITNLVKADVGAVFFEYADVKVKGGRK